MERGQRQSILPVSKFQEPFSRGEETCQVPFKVSSTDGGSDMRRGKRTYEKGPMKQCMRTLLLSFISSYSIVQVEGMVRDEDVG